MFKSINRTDDDLLIPKKKKPSKEPVVVSKKVATSLKLVDHRFAMHISTDKHKYKPGESVHIRGVLLNEFTHMPALRRMTSENFSFKITGPSGGTVFGGDSVVAPNQEKSVCSYDWKIPEDMAGGTYTIQIGKRFYDKTEMDADKMDGNDKDIVIGQEDSDFDLAEGSAAFCNIEGSSVTRIGRNGWNCLVRKMVTKPVQKFKVKVEHTRSDRSGVFIAVVGSDTKKKDIWKSLSVNGKFQAPNPGDIVEFEIHEKKNFVKMWVNGSYKGQFSDKMSKFKRPLYMGVFLHYDKNKIVFQGESKGGFFPVATRKFDVQKYEPPKMKLNLDLTKKGYGPNDEVQAILKVERREGGVPPKCDVVATARLDGKEIFRQKYVCTGGSQFISFKLPSEISEGNGSLNCAVTDGVTENTSKTLPILLRKIDCKVYPEGGDLILGIPNGVYVEAKTLYGDPASFEGFLIEKDLLDPTQVKPLVEVRTVHEGRGSFCFTPKANKEYYIKVLKPEGITVPISMPEIKSVGMTIRLLERKSATFKTPISVGLCATRTLETRLALYKKDEVVDITNPITITQGQEKIFKLDPKDCDGVLRLTAFFVSPDFGVTELRYPVCERLIFIRPPATLDLEISTAKKVYTPGEKVDVRVIPKLGGNGMNIPTVLCCTVTDDSVVEMQEKRKRAPRLLEMVYLENEVKELKDCQAYLGASQTELSKMQKIGFVDPEVCTDLLLGTQGWRRFIYVMQQKNHKFYEDPKFRKFDRDFFFRMLNIPNPEYEERKNQHDSSKHQILRNEYSTETESDYSSSMDEESDDFDEEEEDEDFELSIPARSVVKKKAKKFRFGKKLKTSITLDKKPKILVFDEKMVKKDGKKKSMAPIAMPKKAKMEMSKKERKKPPMKQARIRRKEERRKEADEEEGERINISSFAKIDDIVFGEDEGISLEDMMDFEEEKKPRKPRPVMKRTQVIEYAREYAFYPRQNKPKGVRDEFVETVFFSPYTETVANQKNNEQEANFSFCVSDSITSYLVKIDAFSYDGIIGSSTQYKVKCQKPFFVDPKLPIEVSMVDKLKVPLGIVNNLPIDAKVKVQWDSKGTQMTFKNGMWEGQVGASQRTVQYFDMDVESAYVEQEKQALTVMGDMTEFGMSDTVTKTVSVQPYGFLTCQPFSGALGDNEEIEVVFSVDKDIYVKHSLETVAYVTPSSLGSFMTSVNGLIREPYGCFEQVSSTMYPMIMAKQFLLDQKQPMNERIEKFLKKGYDKLVGYEISGGGFDWYGSAPANESLSALGLAQFVELQKVYAVDKDVIERTKSWLLSRMTKTGFMRNSGRYAYGHAKEYTTNAYIVWALSRSGMVGFEDVEGILSHIMTNGLVMSNRKNDNYVTALLSITYFNFGKFEESAKLAQMLMAEQQKDGCLNSAADTITRSGGRNRFLECTALATLAWLNSPASYSEAIANSINYILKNCKCGCYGSTQSTVLCLQAIIKYFGGSDMEADGSVTLKINSDKPRVIEIPKFQSKAVDFGDFSKILRVDGGENKILLKNNYGKTLPFNFAFWYKISTPPQEQESLPFRFNTSIANPKMVEGDVTEINVELQNIRIHEVKKVEAGLPMIVAIVSIPSGLTPRMERLKELQNLGHFDYFELFGARSVVFYWRFMRPKQIVKFAFEVSATIPGKFLGDASRAYIYYDNDIKFYVKGISVEIDTSSRC